MSRYSSGHLAEQRAPVVDDDELGLLRRAGPHDLLGVGAQHGALAGLAVAEDRAGAARRRRRGRPAPRSFSLTPSSSSRGRRPSARRARARRRARSARAAAAASGPVGPVQAALTCLIRSSTPSPRVSASAVAVDARQRREEVQLALHQAATGPAGRHQRGHLAVDLGVHRVAEPQLEPGAEEVAHRGAEVGPARRADDDVQAEGQAAGGELLDLGLEVVEVGAQRAPAVDDEEDVAVPVVGAARPPGARGRSRWSRCRWRGSRPRDGRRCPCTSATIRRTTSGSARVPTPATCGQRGERRERAAAEVEDEELRLLRRRRQRHARDDRAQQRALAAARAADDRDVAAGAAEVDGEGVAALLARPVDGAERHDQPAERAPLRRRPGRAAGRRRGRPSARRGCRARRAAAARPGGPAGPGPSMWRDGDRRAATRCSPGAGCDGDRLGVRARAGRGSAPRRS